MVFRIIMLNNGTVWHQLMVKSWRNNSVVDVLAIIDNIDDDLGEKN